MTRKLRRQKHIVSNIVGFLAVVVSFILIYMFGAWILKPTTSAKKDKASVEQSEDVRGAVVTERNAEAGQYIVIEITDNGENVKKVNVRHDPWIGQNIGAKLPVGTTFVVDETFVDKTHGSFVGFVSKDLADVDGDCTADFVWISRQYVRANVHTYPWATDDGDFGYHQHGKYGGRPMRVTIADSYVRSQPYTGNNDNRYGRFSQDTFIAHQVYVSDDMQFFGFLVDDLQGLYLGEDITLDADGIVWVYEKNCILAYAD